MAEVHFPARSNDEMNRVRMELNRDLRISLFSGYPLDFTTGDEFTPVVRTPDNASRRGLPRVAIDNGAYILKDIPPSLLLANGYRDWRQAFFDMRLRNPRLKPGSLVYPLVSLSLEKFLTFGQVEQERLLSGKPIEDSIEPPNFNGLRSHLLSMVFPYWLSLDSELSGVLSPMGWLDALTVRGIVGDSETERLGAEALIGPSRKLVSEGLWGLPPDCETGQGKSLAGFLELVGEIHSHPAYFVPDLVERAVRVGEDVTSYVVRHLQKYPGSPKRFAYTRFLEVFDPFNPEDALCKT